MKCQYKCPETVNVIHTVGELIEALRQFPPELAVKLEIGNGVCSQVLTPSVGTFTTRAGDQINAVII